ncbi:MAG: winged helix DNA-binding protein [Alkalibacterium sp.]
MDSSEKSTLLLDKVAELNHHYKYLTDRLLHDLGLSHSVVNLIELIGDDEMTLKEITGKSRLDKSTVSRQMNALVRKELVTKTTGTDKRYVYFKLTPQAGEVFNSYHDQLEEKFNTILSGWTEEEAHMLTVLLGRLNRSMTNRMD